MLIDLIEGDISATIDYLDEVRRSRHMLLSAREDWPDRWGFGEVYKYTLLTRHNICFSDLPSSSTRSVRDFVELYAQTESQGAICGIGLI